VNNNGNVTFDSLLPDYTPLDLLDEMTYAPNSEGFAITGIIAPFWADVDTRGGNSGVTTYGTNTVGGRAAFGVTWPNVGYFRAEYDKSNTFQLVLIDRGDRGAGDFDLEFNYAQIQWETVDYSGGWDGLGGSSARVGFAHASGSNFEFTGSAVNGWFLDTNPADGTLNPTGLIYTNFNSTIPGRYVMQFHDGTPLALPVGLTNAPQTQLSSQSRSALNMQLMQPKSN